MAEHELRVDYAGFHCACGVRWGSVSMTEADFEAHKIAAAQREEARQ